MPVLSLIALCVASILSAIGLVSSFHEMFYPALSLSTTSFAIGMGLAILTWPFFKLQTLYTFEHESIHAVATFCCGGKLISFFVRNDGNGQVYITKSNLLVSLAPYFFPLFSIAAFLLSTILMPIAQEVFTGAAGFLYLNFLRHTRRYLTVKQPDLFVNERHVPILIKYAIIALGNLFFLICWTTLLEQFPLPQLLGHGWKTILTLLVSSH